ncbi:hypothetical protein RB598_002085 [Gaeumannomyces tritici]
MLESRIGGRQRPLEPVYTRSRSRTTSSNTFPNLQAPQPTMQVHPSQPQGGPQFHPSRRSPSVNTFSSHSSGGGTMVPPAAYRTSPPAHADHLQRSTSNRSAGASSVYPTSSYVALLRKQKATVWSERAQPEDPRMVQAQRAAKMRANLEVTGRSDATSAVSWNTAGGPNATGSRTGTGLSSAGNKVAAKIRHHGKPGVVGYSPDNSYAAGVGGVPLRLSATEVEGGDSEDDDNGPGQQQQNRMSHHRRTGSSGRSSTTSIRLRQQHGGSNSLTYRSSGGLGSLGSAAGRRWSPGDTPERQDSLSGGANPEVLSRPPPGADDDSGGRARSFASGSSAERADNVPDMSAPRAGGSGPADRSALNAALTREKSTKNVDELKRRGSVDERTMTLTGSAGRLFIANPD